LIHRGTKRGIPGEGTERGYQEICGWGYWINGGVPGKVAGSRRDGVLRGLLDRK